MLLPSPELDFDTLSLSSAPNASSSEGAPPVPSTSSAAATLDPSANDLIEALTAQLSDAQAANDQLRKIVRERCGKEMGLEALLGAGAAADEAAPLSDAGKGKAKAQAHDDDGEAIHKDDDHYYESYQYNGEPAYWRSVKETRKLTKVGRN
ncbi:MAG: hypothetical protein LBE44_02125 [Microbacterium hominis]|jgi:hypothetical protein|nr:hypothetical protein [Microbacterium hominis]